MGQEMMGFEDAVASAGQYEQSAPRYTPPRHQSIFTGRDALPDAQPTVLKH